MKIPKPVGKPRKVWGIVRPIQKSVVRQDFKFPDGSVQKFYLWASRRNISVLIFPVTVDGKVVLVRQWRPGASSCILELPGGSLEKGQTVLEAVRKELLEETGYKSRRIVPLASCWAEPTTYKSVFSVFLALDCRKVREPEPEPSELIETKEVPLKQWLARDINSKATMHDVKTLAATLLVLPYLKPYLNK